MLDCASMSDLRLRFCNAQHSDLALDAGVLSLASGQEHLEVVDAAQPWLLQLRADRRGCWLTASDGAQGIHVNGRPIVQLAMLRAGDRIHAEGQELQLYRAQNDPADAVEPSTPTHPTNGDLRCVLRGLGGIHHGRSLSLERACRVGSDSHAELRLLGEDIAPEHARIAWQDDGAMLYTNGHPVTVNGLPARTQRLRNGDQLCFGAYHRFVLESPPPVPEPLPELVVPMPIDPAAATAARGWAAHVPWLLLSALLLAAAMMILLLFGAG